MCRAVSAVCRVASACWWIILFVDSWRPPNTCCWDWRKLSCSSAWAWYQTHAYQQICSVHLKVTNQCPLSLYQNLSCETNAFLNTRDALCLLSSSWRCVSRASCSAFILSRFSSCSCLCWWDCKSQRLNGHTFMQHEYSTKLRKKPSKAYVLIGSPSHL